MKVKSYNFKFDYNMFANDIVAFSHVYEMTYQEIDELAGVGNGTCSRIVNGASNNKMNTWLSIANAMDIDVRTYFVLDV